MRSRNVHLWLPGWLRQRSRRPRPSGGVRHLHFCLADHYEPYWGGAGQQTARRIVREWCSRYPEIAQAHRDSFGRPPQHSYFYPQEEYDGLCFLDLHSRSNVLFSTFGDQRERQAKVRWC